MAGYSLYKEYGNQTNSSKNNNLIPIEILLETETIFMLCKVFFFLLFAENVVKTYYD